MNSIKPIEGFAAIAALGCILLGLYGLKISVPNTIPASPKPVSSAPPVRDEVALIKTAIREADEAEVRALRRRSTEGLEQYFTGAALEMERKRVEDSVRDRQRTESQLVRLEFNDVRYTPGEDKATVIVTEIWRSDVFDQDSGTRVRSEGETSNPQRQELILQGGRWRVASFEHFTKATPEPIATPAPVITMTPSPTTHLTPRPERTKGQDTDYVEADSEVRDAIQSRYNARAEAFANYDLEAYFDYAAPNWEWRSESGDHSTLSEARAYYQKVFEKGEARALQTRIVKAYSVRENVVLTTVLIGTVQGEDEGRLIAQIDLWVHDEDNDEWYCAREYRLGRSDSFNLSDMSQALKTLED